MSSSSLQSGPSRDTARATAVTRRHLLTSHGSQHAPPSVVLHLPDLDALSAVALGPPQRSARRRVDAPHYVTANRPDENNAAAPTAEGDPTRQLLKILRVPLLRSAPQWLAGGGAALGRSLVLLQQPKMALAAVVAIGLQLAAVLAMFSGTGKHDATDGAAGGAGSPGVSAPIAVHGGPNDPIQTPATVFGGSPALPPQTLPGLDAEDLPAWPGAGSAPKLVGPSALPAAQANQPAKLAPPAQQSPTLAPPTLSAPTLPQLTGPRVAPTVQS